MDRASKGDSEGQRFLGDVSLGPGDHVCAIYKPGDEIDLVVPFTRLGLEKNERLLRIDDAHTPDAYRDVLGGTGLDVDGCLARGQLVFRSADEILLRTGRFDPDGAIAALRSEVAQARAEGHASLWLIIEMTWWQRETLPLDRLIEYEARLSKLLAEAEAAALCLYDRDRLPAEALLAALDTHPVVAIGSELHDNPHCLAAEHALRENRALHLLQHRLDGLAARKHSHQALKRSETQYRSFVENFHGIAFRGGMDFVPVFFHGAVEKITGYRPEELMAGAPRWDQLIHPEDQSAFFRRVENARKIPSEPAIGEHRILTRDGQTRWIRQVAQYVCDSEGNPLYVDGVLTDITERRRMEDALRESEERLSKFIELADNSFHILDADLRILEINRRALEALFEADASLRSKDQVVGRYFGELYPFLEAELPPIRRIAETGERYRNKLVIPHPTRGDLVVSFVCFKVGENIGIIADDITERERAEQALRESEAMLRTSQEIGRIGSWELDLATEELRWSDQLYRLMGMENDGKPLSAQTALSLVHPDDRERTLQVTTEAAKARTPYQLEYRVIQPDGTEVTFSIDGDVVRNDRGEVVKLCGTTQDITAARQAEEEKKHLQAQLQQAQKMEALGTLAGGVAHDMNNVLTAVLGIGSVLESELSAADPKLKDVQDIVRAAERGKSLVRNLLGFAHKGAFQRRPLGLNDTVLTAVEMLQRTVSKKVVFRLALREQLPEIEGDPSQLTQALTNLCLNAVDAMRGEGVITVTTDEAVLTGKEISGLDPGRYVRLQVRDTGSGMDEETCKRAFEPFFTTKDVGQGTGLGLSMVYRVVRNHGGSASLESSLGRGTTVSLWLPAQAPTELAEAEALPPPSAVEPRDARARVLIVDDEEIIRRTGKRMFSRLGYDVVVADSGASALDFYRHNADDIDLVVLDLSMPQMDGVECFARLRELDADVKVLICTGHASHQDSLQMIADGALGVVHKPFSLKRLRQALSEVLGES